MMIHPFLSAHDYSRDLSVAIYRVNDRTIYRTTFFRRIIFQKLKDKVMTFYPFIHT